MKRILTSVLWMLSLSAFAVPERYITFDLQDNDTSQTVNFKQATAPRLAVRLEQDGRPFKDLEGYSAKFFYAVDITVTPFVSITTTNFNRAKGEAIFDLTTANLNTNGSFIGVVQIYNSAGRPFFFGEFNVEIETAPFNTGAGALTQGDSVDYTTVTGYTGVAASGPYRAGSNITFSANADGSQNINSSATGADNLGNHTMTTVLNAATFAITNVGGFFPAVSNVTPLSASSKPFGSSFMKSVEVTSGIEMNASTLSNVLHITSANGEEPTISGSARGVFSFGAEGLNQPSLTLRSIGTSSYGAGMIGYLDSTPANGASNLVGNISFGNLFIGYHFGGTLDVGNASHGSLVIGEMGGNTSSRVLVGDSKSGVLGLVNLTGAETNNLNANEALGIGAVTITNDQSIVVGDGEESQGVGSITASGKGKFGGKINADGGIEVATSFQFTGDIVAEGLRLEDGNGSAPTVDGQIKYDRTTGRLQVGNGSGTDEFYSGSGGGFESNHVSNIEINWVSTNTVEVASFRGYGRCADSTNATMISFSTNLTIDLDGYLDTGLPAIDTDYHIYIADSDNNSGGEYANFSTSTNGPSGAARWRYIGSVKTKLASKEIIYFNRIGRGNDIYIEYDGVDQRVELELVTSGTATTFTPVDCTPVIPDFWVDRVLCEVWHDNGNDTANIFYIRAGDDAFDTTNRGKNRAHPADPGGIRHWFYQPIEQGTQQFDYRISTTAGSAKAHIIIKGYHQNL